MDKEGGPSLKIESSSGLKDLGTSGDMVSTLQPVPAPNSSSRLALPGLTPASPVQKPPPSQYSMPPRSQPFPTGHCQKALFATGKAVVVVDWTCSNNPWVQSKVAPASDSGPEPSVE
ncbi:hypothetical protein BU17DRAFT_79089 [Hysterangium stoloniferum]|nr:hypothetical protein BU17DRAFT_79089 [Hysterangium stoloniferum]